MSGDVLKEARDYEEAIAEEAATIREDATALDAALFLKLWPLLKRPIPSGFIENIGITKGKPYPSTGVRSVQVQIDRMNNVLTPMWWGDEVVYEEGGKLATVTVKVFGGDPYLVYRSSKGGVGQGSGLGNIYKGSYTNAAKIAFARIGPGHEVYLGAADLDPDVSQDLADAATANPQADSQPPPSKAGFAGLDEVNVERFGKVIRTLALPAERINLLFGTLGADAPQDADHNGHLRVALSALSPEQAKQLDAELEQEAERDA